MRGDDLLRTLQINDSHKLRAKYTEMITRERENVNNLFENTLYPKLYSTNLKDQMHTPALHGGQKG